MSAKKSRLWKIGEVRKLVICIDLVFKERYKIMGVEFKQRMVV